MEIEKKALYAMADMAAAMAASNAKRNIAWEVREVLNAMHEYDKDPCEEMANILYSSADGLLEALKKEGLVD